MMDLSVLSGTSSSAVVTELRKTSSRYLVSPSRRTGSSLVSTRTCCRHHRQEVARSEPLTSPIPLRSTNGISHNSVQVIGREMTWERYIGELKKIHSGSSVSVARRFLGLSVKNWFFSAWHRSTVRDTLSDHAHELGTSAENCIMSPFGVYSDSLRLLQSKDVVM